MSKKKKPNKNNNSFVKYSSIGFQMAAIIGLGVWGGIELDKIVNIEFPLFTILLSMGSVGIAIYHAIKDFINM
ncbi:MAG: AtpZ/AtpI family protein [Bacteroidota bacterium]|nr:AtpZ/AtpI family protein [Bacteroidota bacterium]